MGGTGVAGGVVAAAVHTGVAGGVVVATRTGVAGGVVAVMHITDDAGPDVAVIPPKKCTGRLVVNNDGLHGMRTRSGSYTLKKGYASISIYYFERGGGAGLYVHWKGPGFKKKPLGG